MKGFIYGQTEYNILASCNRLDEYIGLAREASFDFLTITDSNLYGCYKFYKKCKEASINPIIGLEYTFICDDSYEAKALLYAKNNQGFKELIKITSRVKIDGINSINDILEYKNIYIIYVFNDSYLERLFLKREFAMLDSFLASLDSNSYIGVSYTNKLEKLDVNSRMEAYAKERNIKTIPVHQCYYPKNKDYCICEALSLINNKPIQIGEFDDYSFDSNPIEDERIESFVNSISLNLFNEKIELPKYPHTNGVSSDRYLKALCYKGLERRGFYNDNYLNRLNYELDVIHKMGYDDYFLIVWDFIKYSKKNDILVGPGRGSAAGSLVAYCLGITEVNPIEYDLLFERFLNPERVSMPDIDTDFPDIKRDDVIKHVQDIYGKDHICNISAFGTFQIKSSVRELARISKLDSNRITKIIDMVERVGFDELLKEYEGTELYQFLYIARGLEGLPKHISTHAAGIILSSKPLDDIIPLQDGINGLFQSQLEASDLEKIGLLKMDFLGIRNLTIVSNILKDINFSMNDLRNIPLDDSKVYKMLSEGDTLGVFQLESQGIRKVLMKLKPTCFEDLVAVLALYRPGPMDNIDDFIARKHGTKVEYIHEDLIPILNSTYGIIVYQEQIMRIAQVFAGFSLGEADILRRAVSKKDSSKLEAMSKDFINRSIEKGYNKDTATKIYQLIYKFANYGFNRSHTVAYGILAYQMAYLKVNYFSSFMANILNNVISTQETMLSYFRYARARGLIINKPNINVSTNKFVVTRCGIFMPFNAILSIGESASIAITEEREKNGLFKSYNDFKERATFLNSNIVTALVFAGALDIFNDTKKSMLESYSKEDEIFLKHIEKPLSKIEYDLNYLRDMEKKYLGFNIEYNIFNNTETFRKKHNLLPLNNLNYKWQTSHLIHFINIKEIKTKKNEKMLLGELEDNNTIISFVIFPKSYSLINFTIDTDNLFIATGTLKNDNYNKNSFVIDQLFEYKNS